MADEIVVFNRNQARLNVTWHGQNGDLPDMVGIDTTEGDVKTIASEAVRTGYIQGIAADPNVNFRDFVVERFDATAELPPRIFLRPKTEFGG